jgi:Homeodomain
LPCPFFCLSVPQISLLPLLLSLHLFSFSLSRERMAYLATHSLPTPASDRAASSPPSDSSSDDSYFNHRKTSSITLLLNPKDDSPTRSTSIKKAMSTTKAKRKRITPDQFSQLMALFEHNDTPSYEIRDKLAGKIGMSNREIQVIPVPANMKFLVLVYRKPISNMAIHPLPIPLGMVSKSSSQSKSSKNK